jgi:hypothetical protein
MAVKGSFEQREEVKIRLPEMQNEHSKVQNSPSGSVVIPNSKILNAPDGGSFGEDLSGYMYSLEGKMETVSFAKQAARDLEHPSQFHISHQPVPPPSFLIHRRQAYEAHPRSQTVE